jgi:hypothetical protein
MSVARLPTAPFASSRWHVLFLVSYDKPYAVAYRESAHRRVAGLNGLEYYGYYVTHDIRIS